MDRGLAHEGGGFPGDPEEYLKMGRPGAFFLSIENRKSRLENPPRPDRLTAAAAILACHPAKPRYISTPFPMPKTTPRSKTRKSVAKRFKVTATGKILRSSPGKRHLLQCKSAKRKRNLAKASLVSPSDTARIKANLPFA